ncbi:hypothetical protein MPTK1_8g14780 [Marchantia polymorpha subsp. ruderalis]|uniref:Glycosyltransferase subfamily 4-like N-terminal domain-containing protein n=1 Tax=Marchantia polymorpha TaxID=3197 RepID=A0A2R6W519_MARPO|nr:hypothetical protein MARPO_0151s0028 [Marchantia polymorpha]BBN19909.1 hypothetical protein Mp_8g14780 [Marchantia polymorpha subsp. ruderalis]|eukprot:PTQ28955.1 hypothetical protein MARPO_0151s0028 [Marchantia polymorpha]
MQRRAVSKGGAAAAEELPPIEGSGEEDERERERERRGEEEEEEEDYEAMAAGGKGEGGIGDRRKAGLTSRGGLSGCSWQCCWALLMAVSMFLYTLAIFGSSCSGASSAGWNSNDDSASYKANNLFGKVRGKMALPLMSFDEQPQLQLQSEAWSGDLRTLVTPWNRLCYGSHPPEKLRIALFVKKWPVGGTPGGLERHAMTLHRVLADRGHDVHVFTMSGDGTHPDDVHEGNLHVHFVRPNSGGGYQYSEAWEQYSIANATQAFDLVHSESVALPHWRAKEVTKLAASWHGIAFEVIHSDIVHDLIRKPGEPRSNDLQKSLSERLSRVSEEVRFFHSYKHHVATSDYVGDVLRTIYELPEENVHTILNGVDQMKFRPDPVKGAQFRAKYGVPANASLVLGAAGRLVRDKGHPLLFEAFSEILKEHKDVYLLIAGAGPWGERYKELAPNAKTLGPMTPVQLGEFYNALDIFVNPTLRSQGLDHTLLEAMQCGKPLLATKFSSITWSVVISKDFGYTFSPNVDALIQTLKAVINDGKMALREKGESCLQYASFMFTATKMASAYERLFLCMKNETYCHYPLPHDCPPPRSKYFHSL